MHPTGLTLLLAVVRSLFAALCGLAGWIVAVLVVRTTSARIALDDRSLVLIAVALPVAAAVCWGWHDRRRPRRARTTGLAAAVAGVVIGSWLGSGAGEDLVAVFSAIVGGVAGANLALVAYDLVSAPVGEDRYSSAQAIGLDVRLTPEGKPTRSSERHSEPQLPGVRSR
jgi:hypothetical protein